MKRNYHINVMLQPVDPPSFTIPYLVSLWVLMPIGSLAITAIVDFARRDQYKSRFFWRHCWQVIPLAALTNVLTWFLNNGYPTSSPSPFNPFLVLLAVFTTTHSLWIVLVYFVLDRSSR